MKNCFIFGRWSSVYSKTVKFFNSIITNSRMYTNLRLRPQKITNSHNASKIHQKCRVVFKSRNVDKKITRELMKDHLSCLHMTGNYFVLFRKNISNSC